MDGDTREEVNEERGRGRGRVCDQQIGRQTPALSQMIERSSASQETASEHYQVSSRKKKNSGFWISDCESLTQTSRIFRLFQRLEWDIGGSTTATPKGKKLEL